MTQTNFFSLRSFALSLLLSNALLAANAALTCSGTFDVYFLLDRSASVQENYKESMIPFVRSVSENFVSEQVQVSLIWFGTEGHLMLPLTNNHLQIQETLNYMQVEPEPLDNQGTNIGSGLSQVQLRNDADVNKLVFIVSDGCDNGVFQESTIREVNKLKQAGVEVYVVYIPSGAEKCPDYLKAQVAGAPVEDHFFPLNEQLMYEQLNRPDFIDTLVSKSCLQVDSVTPDYICGEVQQTVTVTGKGFLLTEDLSKFYCRFEDCKDNQWYIDTAGQGCDYYKQNPQACPTEQFASLDELKVHCPAACGLCTACNDDPTYSGLQCEAWAMAGECNHNQEWMHVHCRKSCRVCGAAQVPAVVLSDSLLMCRSPPLTADLYYFEVTRNGKTWTQGYNVVKTGVCEARDDDMNPFLMNAAVDIAVDIQPLTFNAPGTAIRARFEVRNTGEVALNGPFQIFSDSMESSCPRGILAPKDKMLCEARYLTTADDILVGKIEQVVYASGTFGERTIESPRYRLVIDSTYVQTPPPTLPPTLPPTVPPTTPPTAPPTASLTLPPTTPLTSPPTLPFTPPTITSPPTQPPTISRTPSTPPSLPPNTDIDTDPDSSENTTVPLGEPSDISSNGADLCASYWTPSSIECVPLWMWIAAGVIVCIMLPLLLYAMCGRKPKKQVGSGSKNEILSQDGCHTPSSDLTPGSSVNLPISEHMAMLEAGGGSASKKMPPPLPVGYGVEKEDGSAHMSYHTVSERPTAEAEIERDENVVQMQFRTMTRNDNYPDFDDLNHVEQDSQENRHFQYV